MIDVAGGEAGLQLVVDCPGTQAFLATGVVAGQLGIRGPAVGVDLLEIHVGSQVAEFLARGDIVIEAVLEVISEHAFGAIEFLVVLVAFVEVVAELDAVVAHHRAFVGEA